MGQLLQTSGIGLRGPHPRLLGPEQPLGPDQGAGGQTGQPESTRVEYRSPDSACNPYLAFAVILAAGLEGIEKGYGLPPEADANLFTLSPEELANKGILHLPGSLNEALGLMESSELLADTLGEHVFEWFIRNKRAEWAEYKAHVTQFELDRYFPLL